MTSIFNCFKRDRTPSEETKVPQPTRDFKDERRVLVLPGHQLGGGMRTFKDDWTETKWNRMVARHTEEWFEGKNTLVRGCEWRHEKDYGTYVKRVKEYCKENKVDLCFEIHINAAGVPEARGAEMLVRYGDDDGAIDADVIMQQYSHKFKIALRGNYKQLRGVKGLKRRDRGALLLHELGKVGTSGMIFEPFFGDYPSKEALRFLEKPVQGSMDMAMFLAKVLGRI